MKKRTGFPLRLDMSRPRADGYKAFKDGLGIAACPYRLNDRSAESGGMGTKRLSGTRRKTRNSGERVVYTDSGSNQLNVPDQPNCVRFSTPSFKLNHRRVAAGQRSC